MADTGKIKEMKDREERCERAQKYVDELLEVHQRVATGVRLGMLRRFAERRAREARESRIERECSREGITRRIAAVAALESMVRAAPRRSRHAQVQFEAKGTQKKLNALRKRAAAAAEDEARCLDAELVIARRQKLKDLYASDYDRYQVELEAMGLSLNFE